MPRLLTLAQDGPLLTALRACGLSLEPASDEARARNALCADEADGLLLDAAAARATRERLRCLAHDLRGPLALLRGHTEILLRMPASPAELAESLAEIHAATLRLAQIVEQQVEPKHGT